MFELPLPDDGRYRLLQGSVMNVISEKHAPCRQYARISVQTCVVGRPHEEIRDNRSIAKTDYAKRAQLVQGHQRRRAVIAPELNVKARVGPINEADHARIV